MEVIHISKKQGWLRSHTKKVLDMLTHFNTYRVVAGSGVKDGSCCAVVLRGGKDKVDVYGNSQAHKLDHDAKKVSEEIGRGNAHAEVLAFELGKDGVQGPSVIFCELSPCPKCQERFANIDVTIVYLFDYQTEREKWRKFHNLSVEAQKAEFRKQAGL